VELSSLEGWSNTCGMTYLIPLDFSLCAFFYRILGCAMSISLYDLDFSGTRQLSDSFWCCSLCHCNISSQSKFNAHIQKIGHLSKLTEFKAKVETGRVFLSRFDKVSNIKRRASELCETWENRVLAQLFRYMARDIDDSTDTSHYLQEAERLLGKYERMERFCLLELAVWKATCTQRAGEVKVDPNNVKTVEDTIRFAQKLAEKQHSVWKDYKTEMRHSNAIEIIMSLVLPFVGKH
jgi:hypothetical protein